MNTGDISFSVRFSRRARSAEEIPAEEAERRLLARLETDGGWDALYELVRLYKQIGREDLVRETARVGTGDAYDLETRALFHVTLGQSYERGGELEEAIEQYRNAVALEPRDGFAAYFAHNNLAFCLNLFGQHDEAERLCRVAIRIDPTRPNAYKNLGLSLERKGCYVGAARAWVEATRANAADGRSLALLEDLLRAQPELVGAVPGLPEAVQECRRAVRLAREMVREERGD